MSVTKEEIDTLVKDTSDKSITALEDQIQVYTHPIYVHIYIVSFDITFKVSISYF